MKEIIEEVSISYCLSVEGCKNASDFERKGREAKRTIAKMLTKEIWNRKLAELDVDFQPAEKIIIVRAKIDIIKKENDNG